ncbi:hypothetical protein Tco_1346241 [Tanacetum coccineum]
MSTYLKNMAGYKHNQLKNKSFDDVQNETRTEGNSKRAGEDLQQDSIKNQKVDEDNETTELQRLIEVVPDKEEVAIDAIPLATKPPSIEDLETLWKLVKAKHGSTRPEEGYERVLWGDLKIMFDPHVEDQLESLKLLQRQLFRSLEDWEVSSGYAMVQKLKKAIVIMEYLVKISKKARILELKRRHLKKLTLTSYTSYPSRKIRRICACTSQEPRRPKTNMPYPEGVYTPYSI